MWTAWFKKGVLSDYEKLNLQELHIIIKDVTLVFLGVITSLQLLLFERLLLSSHIRKTAGGAGPFLNFGNCCVSSTLDGAEGEAKTLPRRFMKSRTHIEGYEIKKIQLTLCLNMIVWMWHCRILTENPGSLQSVFSVRNSIRCTHCEKLPEFQFSFPLAQLFGQRTRSPNSSCLKNLPIHLYWKIP